MLPVTSPVIVTEHFPEDSVHEIDESLTVPVPETFDHIMVPICVRCPPDTVAVHVVDSPTPNVD